MGHQLFLGFPRHKYIPWLFKEMIKMRDRAPLTSRNSHIFRVVHDHRKQVESLIYTKQLVSYTCRKHIACDKFLPCSGWSEFWLLRVLFTFPSPQKQTFLNSNSIGNPRAAALLVGSISSRGWGNEPALKPPKVLFGEDIDRTTLLVVKQSRFCFLLFDCV